VAHANPYSQVNSERNQDATTRQHLFPIIEKYLEGRRLITLHTSFVHPASLEDADTDMVQSLLQHEDLSKGLAIMISSPGGDGLAAERMVRVCRSCSGTGDFWAIVPGKSKSAGTLVCMGASKILMAPASELGPVDPQIIRVEDGVRKAFSADSLVSGYDKLFDQAVKTKGHMEPYIQQLRHYDVRDINKYRSYIKLSENMAIKILSTGMMKGKSTAEIRKKIKMFLEPEAGTHAHGRPIYGPEAEDCDLCVQHIDIKTDLWKHVYELYVRTNRFVSSPVAAKAAESGKTAFYQAPSYGEDD
jgi:Serine dehydrogenase proteinase